MIPAAWHGMGDTEPNIHSMFPTYPSLLKVRSVMWYTWGVAVPTSAWYSSKIVKHDQILWYQFKSNQCSPRVLADIASNFPGIVHCCWSLQLLRKWHCGLHWLLLWFCNVPMDNFYHVSTWQMEKAWNYYDLIFLDYSVLTLCMCYLCAMRLYTHCRYIVASYPGLLAPAFVTCSTNASTASDKRWGKKAWVWG